MAKTGFLFKILKICLIVVAIAVVAFTAYEYWATTHRIKFNVEEKYKISLVADECGLCFLDWPIDFIIKVTDLQTNKKYRHKFWMGHGPYVKFGIPKNGKNELIIYGEKYNNPNIWTIDFNENRIDQLTSMVLIEAASENYIYSKKLNNKFEIENIEH